MSGEGTAKPLRRVAAMPEPSMLYCPGLELLAVVTRGGSTHQKFACTLE